MPPGPFSPLLERTAPSGCVVNVSPNDVLNIRGYPSSVSRMTYPIVYFEDLALDIPVRGRGEGLACDAQEPSGFRPEVLIAAFDNAIDAATEGTRLLQGEVISIAQRNVNAILNQLWKLAGAKSLGEVLDLQAAYCRNQLGAFIRQVQEIQAVSTHVANGLEPIETDVSRVRRQA